MLVLVVEDDQSLREALADALELDGHVVAMAANGREALRAIGQRRPDVILLDLAMPVMDGWEFRRLQRQIDPAIPVVVVSAASEPRLAEVHPDAYLAKPFDIDTLLAVVRGVTRRAGDQTAAAS